VSAVRRFDPRAYRALWRRDLPRPIDVPNLIVRSERGGAYRWYGLLFLPLLGLFGTRLLWAGQLEATLAGEPQADELLIVRYRSHRRFLAMVVNPYYLLINRFRERAVADFQAAFAHARVGGPGLSEHDALVALHLPLDAPDDAEQRVAEALGATTVYRAEQVAALDFLRDHQPSDPLSLALPRIALLAAAPRPAPDAIRAAIERVPDGGALHAYRQESMRALLPMGRRERGGLEPAAG
jgi:hypothetical protein